MSVTDIGRFHKEWCLLNLTTTNMEGLVGDIKVGGSFGSSDGEIVEFSIGQEGGRAASKIVSMDFRRASFVLFWGLLGRILWEQILWGRGVLENSLILGITSARLKNDASQQTRNWAKWARDLCG